MQEPVPGPGPLDSVTRLAMLHVAVLAPSLLSLLGELRWTWTLFPAVLALPFFALVSWGHGGDELRDVLVLYLSAVACGAAGAALRHTWYLPTMVLLFALPFALGYLCEEFGRPDVAGAWRDLSPWALSPGIGVFLLWAWPVRALARRRT